jgi:Arc/MetJ-type ribon-helix-helix transcriptional regulator
MSRINARIPEEQERQMGEIRRATGASVSEIVRAAIERYHSEIVARAELALRARRHRIHRVRCGGGRRPEPL